MVFSEKALPSEGLINVFWRNRKSVVLFALLYICACGKKSEPSDFGGPPEGPTVSENLDGYRTLELPTKSLAAHLLESPFDEDLSQAKNTLEADAITASTRLVQRFRFDLSASSKFNFLWLRLGSVYQRVCGAQPSIRISSGESSFEFRSGTHGVFVEPGAWELEVTFLIDEDCQSAKWSFEALFDFAGENMPLPAPKPKEMSFYSKISEESFLKCLKLCGAFKTSLKASLQVNEQGLSSEGVRSKGSLLNRKLQELYPDGGSSTRFRPGGHARELLSGLSSYGEEEQRLVQFLLLENAFEEMRGFHGSLASSLAEAYGPNDFKTYLFRSRAYLTEKAWDLESCSRLTVGLNVGSAQNEIWRLQWRNWVRANF